jgi:hypothetical protein
MWKSWLTCCWIWTCQWHEMVSKYSCCLAGQWFSKRQVDAATSTKAADWMASSFGFPLSLVFIGLSTARSLAWRRGLISRQGGAKCTWHHIAFVPYLCPNRLRIHQNRKRDRFITRSSREIRSYRLAAPSASPQPTIFPALKELCFISSSPMLLIVHLLPSPLQRFLQCCPVKYTISRAQRICVCICVSFPLSRPCWLFVWNWLCECCIWNWSRICCNIFFYEWVVSITLVETAGTYFERMRALFQPDDPVKCVSPVS